MLLGWKFPNRVRTPDLTHNNRGTPKTGIPMRKIIGVTFIICFLIFLSVQMRSQVPTSTPAQQEQFFSGLEAQQKGDLTAAEKIFGTILDQGGKVPMVYNALGNIYQLRGAHDKALAAFSESERLDPKEPTHHFLAGVSYSALGKWQQAVREFKQAVQIQPENLLFREQLAKSYLRMNNFPGGIEQYIKLLELKPESPEYHYQLGHAYQYFSLSCYEKLKGLKPDSARLYQELGDQYLVQGDMDKAIENYEKARSADPSLPEIHFLLGQFYLKRGEREKALQSVNQALALTPGSPTALALKKTISGQ